MMIVALTPVPRMTQLYIMSSKNRWQFFEQLGQWVFMLHLTEIVTNPEAHCYIEGSGNAGAEGAGGENGALAGMIDAEQHSNAAAQVLQELIEKLSLEDTGELLLQPLGYTPELMNHLIDRTIDFQKVEAEANATAASASSSSSQRRSSARLLCFLLRRAAEPEIMCMMSSSPGSPPVPTVVPNRLFPLRERLLIQMATRMRDIFATLVAIGDSSSDQLVSSQYSRGPVVYSGYVVPQPFTAIRALLVELLALMVESDENVGVNMPVELWRHIFAWALKYPHNNIYHSYVYRLVFAVLRFENNTKIIQNKKIRGKEIINGRS